MTTDTATADLVTEEIVAAFEKAFTASVQDRTAPWPAWLPALRAVAPMIVQRALREPVTGAQYQQGHYSRDNLICYARDLEAAAAIRARGETP